MRSKDTKHDDSNASSINDDHVLVGPSSRMQVGERGVFGVTGMGLAGYSDTANLCMTTVSIKQRVTADGIPSNTAVDASHPTTTTSNVNNV